MRAVKVIATSFQDGRHLRSSSEYPNHNQTVTTTEDVEKMLRDLIAFEVSNTPGMPIDIAIVNATKGHSYFRFIKEQDGRQIGEGKLIVLERPSGEGWSFGSYNFAFENLDYDWWLFTEEDLFIGGDDYYRRMIERFNAIQNCGFLGIIDVATGRGIPHCSGALGLTNKKILSAVHKKFGKLPHRETLDLEMEFLSRRARVIEDGEIPFTNEILKLGYDLERVSKIDRWGFDNNFCLPYFDYKLKYNL